MEKRITVTATYACAADKTEEARAAVAWLQKAGAAEGLSIDDSGGAEGIELVCGFFDHDTLDGALPKLGAALAALTEAAPLRTVHITGPVRAEALKLFRSLDATVTVA